MAAMTVPERGALAALGITDHEEAAYLAVIDGPGATTGEVAAAMELGRRRAAELLASLERKGMVSRTVEQQPRWIPAPPDMAVEALVIRRQEELARARIVAGALAARVREAGELRAPSDLIEVIDDPLVANQRLDQLQAGAEREVLGFVRAPYVRPPAEYATAVERAGLDRGVAYRVVYDAEAVQEVPVEVLRADQARGEQARVFAGLPIKLCIVDRRIAMLPAQAAATDRVDRVLVVRTSALLDALVMFFESIWAQASPIDPVSVGVSVADADALVPLLAAGLSDAAIARMLRISTRSLDRRSQALFAELGASTRFQAGWLAAMRAQQAD